MLLFFPIFLLQFIFTYGLSLLLSALNLFYRDIQYLFDLVMTLWFYLTPVIYATEFFPAEYRYIFKINPMSVFINAYRQVLFNGTFPNWDSLAIGLAVSVGLYLIAHKIFKKLEGMFADVV
jgi:ABC-type polysaccharide/polyol phosphate export permease